MSKKIEVTDIKKLLAEKDSYAYSEVVGSYGVAYQIKKFVGMDPGIPLNRCVIEHGLYINRNMYQWDARHHVPHILTFSPFREEVIRELTDIIPIAIGPYIAYAEDYRPKKHIEKERKKNGRTLLVMPSHSTYEVCTNYNVGQFIQQIEAAREHFDTVIVCMHFADLWMGLWKPYKKKGYRIASAGNIWNPHFLSRLKYILHLSDAVISNEFTTGMAYAMYMNRPVRLVRQQIRLANTGRRTMDCESEAESLCEQIYDMFEQDDFAITKEQREFGKYVFGLDSVKSREEMRGLLLSLSRKTRSGVG